MTEIQLRLKLDHLGYNEEFSKASFPLVASLVDNIEYLKNENNSITKENSSVKHENHDIHESLIELRTRYEEAERTIEDLKIFNAECLHRVEGYENEVKELYNRVAILEDTDSQRGGFLDLEEPLPQQSIDSNQHHHHHYHCEPDHNLLDDLNLALKRCDFLHQQHEIAHQDIQLKTNKLNFYKDQLERAESEALFCRKKYDDIFVENERLRNQVRDLEKLNFDTTSLQKEVTHLRNKNGDLENELNALRSAHINELHDYEKEVENIHQEQMQLSRAITKMRSLENQLKVLEEERDFYRKKYELLKYSSPTGNRRLCDTPPVRDHEYDLGDNPEAKILREERESLREQLNKLQRQLIDVNGNVKTLARERDIIHQNYKKLQKELFTSQEAFMIKDSTNSSAAVARQTMLRRLQTELDHALADIQRLATERDSLRYQLEAQSKSIINEKTQLYRKADDAELYAERARIERDRDKKEMEKLYATTQTLFNDRKVFKDRAEELEYSLKEMDRLRREVISNLESELDETLYENQKLQRRVNELYEEKHLEEEARLGLESERSKLIYQQSELEQEIRMLHTQRNEQITRGNRLCDRVAELEKHNLNLKSELSSRDNQLSEIKHELSCKIQDYERVINANLKLQEDVQKLQEQVQELHEIKFSLEKKNIESEKINADLNREIEQLSADLDVQLEAVKKLETYCVDRENNIVKLEEELHETLHQLEEKTAAISSLHSALIGREKNVEELYHVIDNLQRDLDERREQVCNMQHRIEDLVRHVDSLVHEVQARSNQIHELYHTYERRENKLLDRLARSETLIMEFQNNFAEIYPELESQLHLLNKYQKQLNETQYRAQSLSERLSEITPLFYESNSQLSQTQHDFQKTKELVDSLERRMIEADQKMTNLKEKNEILADENYASADEINRLSALLDGQTRHSSRIEENSKTLETRLYEAENLRAQAEQELRHVEENYEDVTRRNCELETTLSSLNAHMANIKKEFSSKSEQLNAIKTEFKNVENLKARLEKSQVATDELSKRCSELSYQLDCRTDELVEQQKQAEKYYRKVQELSSILEKKDEKISHLSHKLDKLMPYEENAVLTEKVHHQNFELHERLIEAEKLACDLDLRFQEQKKETEIRNQDLVSALQRLESDEEIIANLEARLKTTLKESAQLKNYVSKLSNETNHKRADFDAVQSLLQNKNDLLDQMKKELDRCNSIVTKYEELKLEHHKTVQYYQRLENKFKSLQEKLEDREATIEGLCAQLADKMAELSLLTDKMENDAKFLKNMEMKLSEYNCAFKNKEILLKESSDKIAELSTKLLEKEMECSHVEREIATVRESHASLESQLVENEGTLSDIHEKLSSLVREYTQQGEELDDAKSRLEKAYDRMNHFQSEVKERDKAIHELNTQLSELHSDCLHQSAKIKRMESYLEGVEDNIILMRNSLDDSEKRAAKLHVIKNQQCSEIASLKETVEILEEQLRKSQTEVAFLNETVNEANEQRRNLEFKVSELVPLISEKNNLLEQSVRELNLAQESIQKLDHYKQLCLKQETQLMDISIALKKAESERSQYEKVMEEYNNTTEENYRLENELTILAGRLSTSESAVESLGCQLGEIMAKLNRRTQELEEKCEELESLSEDNTQLKFDVRKYCETADLVNKENEHLRCQLRDLKTLENDFREEIEALEIKRITSETLAKDYSDRLKIHENDIADLRSKNEYLHQFEYLFSKSDATVTHLENERDSLNDKYTKAKYELQCKEVENQELKIKVENLDTDFMSLRKEMKTLKDAAERVADNYEEAIKDNIEMAQKIDRLNQLLMNKEVEQRELSQEISLWKSRTESLTDQLSIERETVFTLEHRIQEFAERTRHAESLAEAFKTDYELCKSQLQQKETKLHNLIEDLIKADRVFGLLSTEKTKLEFELVQLSSDKSNLEDWLTSYRNRLSSIENEVLNRNEGIHCLRQSLCETEHQLNHISHVSRDREAELTHMKAHLEQLRAENFRLIHENSQIPNLRARNCSLEEQMRATQAELHRLRIELDVLSRKNFEYANRNAQLTGSVECLQHQVAMNSWRSHESVIESKAELYNTPPPPPIPDYSSVVYQHRVSTPVLGSPVRHHHHHPQHHPHHHHHPVSPPPGSFLCRHNCLHSANCGLHDLLNHSLADDPSNTQCIHQCKRKGKRNAKESKDIHYIWNNNFNTNCNNQVTVLNRTQSMSCPNSPIKNISRSIYSEGDYQNVNNSGWGQSQCSSHHADVNLSIHRRHLPSNKTYDVFPNLSTRTSDTAESSSRDEEGASGNNFALFTDQKRFLSDSSSESELKNLSRSNSTQGETYTGQVYSTPIQQNYTVSLPYMTHALANISSVVPDQSPLATFPSNQNSKRTVVLSNRSNDDDTEKDCSSVFSSQVDVVHDFSY